MTTIQIFEPGLCCGTGICGVDVDQQLVTVSADIDWATSAGGTVRRFNLAQEPLAFAENDTVRAFLHTVGQEGLPVTMVDGATVLTGRYPSRPELAKWAGLGAPAAEDRPSLLAAPAGVAAAPGLADAAAPAAPDAGCCGGNAGSCC
jgi:arsenite-transporting ATPase